MFRIDTAEALQRDDPALHPFRIIILSLRNEIVDCNLVLAVLQIFVRIFDDRITSRKCRNRGADNSDSSLWVRVPTSEATTSYSSSRPSRRKARRSADNRGTSAFQENASPNSCQELVADGVPAPKRAPPCGPAGDHLQPQRGGDARARRRISPTRRPSESSNQKNPLDPGTPSADAIDDPGLGGIVGRHLHLDLVAYHQANESFAHLP